MNDIRSERRRRCNSHTGFNRDGNFIMLSTHLYIVGFSVFRLHESMWTWCLQCVAVKYDSFLFDLLLLYKSTKEEKNGCKKKESIFNGKQKRREHTHTIEDAWIYEYKINIHTHARHWTMFCLECFIFVASRTKQEENYTHVQHEKCDGKQKKLFIYNILTPYRSERFFLTSIPFFSFKFWFNGKNVYSPCGGLASVIYCLQFENKWHLYTKGKEPRKCNNTKEKLCCGCGKAGMNQPHDKRLSIWYWDAAFSWRSK